MNSPSAARFPAHAFGGGQAGAPRQHLDTIRDDEGRIEAHAELADELRVLLLIARQLLEELRGAGAGDGAEVRDRLLAAHADAVVADGERALVRVGLDPHRELGSPAISSGLLSASKRSLSLASEALEISSRRKISRWLYSEWIMSFSSSRTSAWKPRVSLGVSFVGGCHGAGRLRAPDSVVNSSPGPGRATGGCQRLRTELQMAMAVFFTM